MFFTTYAMMQQVIEDLYENDISKLAVYKDLLDSFNKRCHHESEIYFFSAPGRIELCGNHTDHQKGCVLAAAINREELAVAAITNSGKIRIFSHGRSSFEVNLDETSPKKSERGKSTGIVRGIAAQFIHMGISISGLDIYITSEIKTGSGISSSAAFETLICRIINFFFNHDELTEIELAKIGQVAEIEYFGKPCGLMDQTACAYGGCTMIDFKSDVPSATPVSLDCVTDDYSIILVHTGGSHSSLTKDYAQIVSEMKLAAQICGKDYLSDVDEAYFMSKIPSIREKAGDRAVLRGMHFFAENKRVLAQKAALETGDSDEFFRLITESGDSSALLLQNVYISEVDNKSLALALALTKKFIADNACKGACRVHGGGFMGTILAFIPKELEPDYINYMDTIFGNGQTTTVKIRKEGSIAVCDAWIELEY